MRTEHVNEDLREKKIQALVETWTFFISFHADIKNNKFTETRFQTSSAREICLSISIDITLCVCVNGQT